ncbi:hypothetical protein [Mycobacteroides abscessus]
MKHTTVGAIVAGIALTMGTSSCSRAHGPASDANVYRSTVVAEPGAPWQLQFTAQTVDGSTFSGEDLYGKPAVLWFRTPAQHTAEQHTAQATAATRAEITFAGIVDTRAQTATGSGIQHHMSSIELIDPDGAIASRFGITSRPAYVFITAQGQISTAKNPLTQRELQTRLKRLAAHQPGEFSTTTHRTGQS